MGQTSVCMGSSVQGSRQTGIQDDHSKRNAVQLVVSVLYPDDPNFDFTKIHDYVYERGFTIYPGKVSDLPTFRLCSLGTIVPKDIEDFFECFEEGLKSMGVQVPVTYK